MKTPMRQWNPGRDSIMRFNWHWLLLGLSGAHGLDVYLDDHWVRVGPSPIRERFLQSYAFHTTYGREQ